VKKVLITLFILTIHVFAFNMNDLKLNNMNFMYDKHFNKKLPEMSLIRNAKLKPTLLYFFSKSVTSTTLKNFLIRANKLKDIKSYVVFRGFDQQAKEILLKQKKTKLLAKIHPILFKDLNITRVPVVVYALCPDEFREKECEYLYRMDGDMSLNKFFEVAGEKDENLLKYYDILENGESDDNENNK